jgi:hypothetical protein
MLIYCNGDSFVDGWELGDDLIPGHPGYTLTGPADNPNNLAWEINVRKFDQRTENIANIIELNRQRCFAGLLQSKYGYTVVNNALNGASIDRITRTTITDLIDLKNKHEIITAIIGITSHYRHEVPGDPDEPPQKKWVDIAPHIKNLYKHASNVAEFNIKYETDYHASVKAILNLTHIKNFCSLHGIKLLFVQPGYEYTSSATTPSCFFEDVFPEHNDLTRLVKYLNLKPCLHLKEIAVASGETEIYCPAGHFSPKMHEIFADKISKLL